MILRRWEEGGWGSQANSSSYLYYLDTVFFFFSFAGSFGIDTHCRLTGSNKCHLFFFWFFKI